MSGWLVEGGVYFLLFFTPLAFGGVEEWAEGVFQIVVGIVTAAWAWARIAAPASSNRKRCPPLRLLWTAIGLFVGLVLVQLIPLPPRWIGVLNPGVHDLYTRAVPGYADGAGWRAEDLPSWLLERKRDEIPEPLREVGAPAPPASSSSYSGRASSWRTLSIYPHQTRESLITLGCYLGLFATVLGHFNTKRRLHRLLGVAVMSAFAVSLFGIVQNFTYSGAIYWLRPVEAAGVFGPFVNRISYAAFASTMSPMGICLALLALRQRRMGGPDSLAPVLLWIFVSIVISGGVLLSLARAGIIGLGLSVGFVAAMLLYYGRRTAEIAVLLLMLAGCAGLLLWVGPVTVIERVGTLTEGRSIPTLATRVETWERSLLLLADHLALGTGLGTFRYAFMRYAPVTQTWWRTAHNEYLELLCDTGLVGGVIFLAGLGVYAYLVARPSRFAQRDASYLYVGLLSGLGSLLFQSALSANLQVPANGMLLTVAGGALLRLAMIYGPSRPAEYAVAVDAEPIGARR